MAWRGIRQETRRAAIARVTARQIRRERREAEVRANRMPGRPVYPVSGDPNIIGEHEVPPVLCPCCGTALPWPLIKGWRD